jgi:hypothetical protein
MQAQPQHAALGRTSWTWITTVASSSWARAGETRPTANSIQPSTAKAVIVQNSERRCKPLKLAIFRPATQLVSNCRKVSAVKQVPCRHNRWIAAAFAQYGELGAQQARIKPTLVPVSYRRRSGP